MMTNQQMLNFTLQLAEDAGLILNNFSQKLFKKELKIIDKGADGLASEADLASEKFVIKEIRKKFPDHLILSEEDSFTKKMTKTPPSKDEFLWLIDPLDGTNNFLKGLPFYCVSLALMKGDGVIMGVVHQPLIQETFYAIKDKGAFHRRLIGGKKIQKKLTHHRSTLPFKESLISTNLGSIRHNASLIRKFPEVRAFRRLGSAALELSYVAAGILDAYWDYRLQPWDTAAGGLIALEAGAKVTDLDGREFSPFENKILCSRPKIHSDLLEILKTRK